MKQEKKDLLRPSLVIALTLAIVFGFLAGVVGELWINNFLTPDIKFKSYQDLTNRLDDLIAEKNREIKDILTEYDYSFKSTIDKVNPITVRIFRYKTSGNKLSNVYTDGDVLGAGAILTSDGWILTTKQVVGDPKLDYSVQIQQNIYPVKEILDDVLSDAILLKVDAVNLPVMQMGSKNSLNVGQSLMVATLNRGVKRATIEDLAGVNLESQVDLIQSSENFYRFVKLNDVYEKDFMGAPVANLDGRVIGFLISEDGLVLPIDYLSSILKTAVQQGEIKRNFIGVNYLDLDLAYNFKSNYQNGAYLLGDGQRPAVIANSPAAKSGLQAGDIIIKVESEEINRYHSLTEIIQDYPVGSKLNFKIIRNGQEQDLTVSLETI